MNLPESFLNASLARLLSTLGSEQASHAWRALIEQNSDSYDYYRGFLANQGINLGMHECHQRLQIDVHLDAVDSIPEEKRSEALDVLLEFSSQLPKAAAPRRLALTIATGTYSL